MQPKRLCIYAEAHAGENVKVNVIGTHIWGDASPCVLDSLDTEVQLRVNDEFVENLKLNHVYTYSSTYELQYLEYVSKYIPKEGAGFQLQRQINNMERCKVKQPCPRQ